MVRGLEDKVIDTIVFIILAITSVIVIIPLMSVLSVSLTPITEVIKNGGFVLIPKKITLEAYRTLFSEGTMPRAFSVTVFITVVGTFINMLLSVLLAFPLSRKILPGRQVFMVMIIFTMLFNGGLIPTYMAVKQFGLLDSVWAMILPNAIWTFNILVLKSFFENLPEELFESARMDGANEFTVLGIIVIPLSMPVMMTVGLFYMVGHWNQFFQAVLYVGNSKLHPIQVVVRGMLMAQNNPINADITLPTETLKMAAVVFVSIPKLVAKSRANREDAIFILFIIFLSFYIIFYMKPIRFSSFYCAKH